jgi:hypothetical protein
MQISSPQLFPRNYSAVKNNSSSILRPTLSASPTPYQLSQISILVLCGQSLLLVVTEGKCRMFSDVQR